MSRTPKNKTPTKNETTVKSVQPVLNPKPKPKAIVKLAENSTSKLATTKKEDNESKTIVQAADKLREHEKHPHADHKKKESKKLVKSDLSPYSRCLLSPFEFKAAQIPDANTFPSSTFNITQKFAFTADDNSTYTSLGTSFAICIGSRYQSSVVSPYLGGNILPMNDSSLTPVRTFGCYCTGPAGDSNYLFSGAASVETIVSTPLNSFASDYIKMWRPVCAAIKVSLVGPALSKQGYMVGAVFPRQGISNNGATGGVNFNAILNHPTAQQVGAFDSIQCNYAITDNVNYEYLDPRNLYTAPTAWRDNRGELWVVGVGLQGNETVLVEVTVGVEMIPQSGILSFITPTPSWSNPIEKAQAENLESVTPKVFDVGMTNETIDALETEDLFSHGISTVLLTKNNRHTLDSQSRVLKAKNGTVGFIEDVHATYKAGRSFLSDVLKDLEPFTKYLKLLI